MKKHLKPDMIINYCGNCPCLGVSDEDTYCCNLIDGSDITNCKYIDGFPIICPLEDGEIK